MKLKEALRIVLGLRIKRYLFFLLGGVLLFLIGFGGIWQSLRIRTGILKFIIQSINDPFIGIVLLLAGFFLVFYGIYGIYSSLNKYIRDSIYDPRIVKYVVESHELAAGEKYVVIGGGTGISNILQELKRVSSNITAVVTVTDEGGSSGRLRTSMNILPPGDIRNCLVALAEDGYLLSEIFQYRFKTEELKGHSLGNLLIAGLSELKGGIINALIELEKILAIRGRVLPSTLDNVRLKAIFEDGTEVVGEVNIAQTDKRIKEIRLIPEEVKPLPEVLQSIYEADYIFLGPGSLYTSIIPNVLIKDINQALRESRGKKIFISNIVTQKYETYNMTMYEHIKAMTNLLPAEFVDYVFVHSRPLPSRLLEKYKEEESYPVKIDRERLREFKIKIIYGDFLRDDVDYLRHSALKIVNYIKQNGL